MGQPENDQSEKDIKSHFVRFFVSTINDKLPRSWLFRVRAVCTCVQMCF